MKYYQNAAIFNGRHLLYGYSLAVADKQTVAVVADAEVSADSVIDLGGGILTPGYVELQANGGGGVLFNDSPTLEGIQTMLAAHRRFGTVAMLPTFITDATPRLEQAIQAIRQGIQSGLAGLIGGHFEGPFINIGKKGTHQADFIRSPDNSDYQRFNGKGLGNSLITLAPECVSPEFISHLSAQGFAINAGHTLASKADMLQAYQHGLGGVTHLYNAMPPLQGRAPSVIGSAAALGLTCGIIVDGVHSDAFSLQTAYRLFGKQHLMLVTDSMHTIGAEGMTDFMLTGQRVYVRGDRLVNEDGNLAGAHITMEQSVKNARKYMQISTADALTMAITTPAHYIKRPDLSCITPRSIDDILYLDDSLSLQPLPQEA